MARGIMADKEDKVASPTSEQPTNSTKIRRNSSTLNIHNINSNRNSTNDHSSNGGSTTEKPILSSSIATTPTSTCSCTKISTMQLFYEMKQKFPTVPDNVVCEFVGQNCHNRSACIDGLEDYPNSANVYPQALRNQPSKKKQTTMTTTTQCATTGTNLIESQSPQQQQKPPTIKDTTNTTDSEQMTAPTPTSISHVQRKVAPPTTLNLTNLNCCTRPVNRPTRQAPPPPTTPTAAAVASTTTPTQSIKSLPNQPLNLSVNVIVSPVTRTPTNKSQQSQQSHYSFTLHQPNNNNPHSSTHPLLATTMPAAAADVQSAADTIAAKTPTSTATTTAAAVAADAQQYDVPSLTYTSSAYDAEIGYQSRFEITVAGMNMKPNNDNNNNCDDPLKNDNATTDENNISSSSNVSLTRSCEITNTTAAAAAAANDQNHHQLLPSVVASAEFLEESKCSYSFFILTPNLIHPVFFSQKMKTKKTSLKKLWALFGFVVFLLIFFLVLVLHLSFPKQPKQFITKFYVNKNLCSNWKRIVSD